jgi:hypothetical protein
MFSLAIPSGWPRGVASSTDSSGEGIAWGGDSIGQPQTSPHFSEFMKDKYKN